MGFGDIRKKKFIEKDENFEIHSVKKKNLIKKWVVPIPSIPSGAVIESDIEEEEETEDDDEEDEELGMVNHLQNSLKSKEEKPNPFLNLPFLIGAVVVLIIYFIIAYL